MKNKMYCPPAGSSQGTNSGVQSTYTATSGMSHTQENNNTAGKFLLGMLAGAGVGLAAGILLAPDKGSYTRKSIANSAGTLGRGMGSALNSGRDKVMGMFGNSKSTENTWVAQSNSSSGAITGQAPTIPSNAELGGRGTSAEEHMGLP